VIPCYALHNTTVSNWPPIRTYLTLYCPC
jgi:hypothetical protein